MIKKWFPLIRSAAALALGLVLYLLFRENTILHTLFPFQSVGILSGTEFFADDFVRYYLPDGLWGYAMAEALYFLFPHHHKKTSFLPAAIACLTGWFYEIMQKVHIFPGTADPVDCWLYLFAALAVYIGNLICSRRR